MVIKVELVKPEPKKMRRPALDDRLEADPPLKVEPPAAVKGKRGRPPASKPWIEAGISRAEWYRRGNRKAAQK